jgi:pyrroline-5-carboxylate reductase
MKGIVLGCGNMSSAIIEGMSSVMDFKNTFFYTPSKTKAQILSQKVKGQFAENLEDIPLDPDFVILACKPQQFAELAKKLKGRFTSSPLYISILAATPRSLHESLLASDRILRVMPNMPARFKKGISLLLSSGGVTGEEKSFWENNFSQIGVVKWTKTEEEFNHLMLLCGSGPAFMYQWLLWLSQMSEDLTQKERETLIISVMEGAMASIKNDSAKSLETLIAEVTSKGGVTAAVLDGWKNENVLESLQKGWEKGHTRTSEIEQIIIQGQ